MKLRVSAVQYQLQTGASFDDFAKQSEHYIKTAEEYTVLTNKPQAWHDMVGQLAAKESGALLPI